jgi:hypothetical protein
MNYIACMDCPYHYKNEDDDFACCHFNGFEIAPCEQEEADYYYNEEQ